MIKENQVAPWTSSSETNPSKLPSSNHHSSPKTGPPHNNHHLSPFIQRNTHPPTPPLFYTLQIPEKRFKTTRKIPPLIAMTDEIREGLKYTKTHEWVKLAGTKAKIGITDHAQHELTDIVFVELPPSEKKSKKEKNSASSNPSNPSQKSTHQSAERSPPSTKNSMTLPRPSTAAPTMTAGSSKSK